MDINHLRGWAEFMDKALVVSIIVAVIAVAAVGVSAFYSVRFAGAIRAQENAAFDRYKSEWGQHATQLEANVAEARDRITQLERTAADADERVAQAGREQAKANQRAAASEKDAAQARQRVAELEKAIEQASARPAERETSKEAPEATAPAAEPSSPEPRNKQVVTELAKFAGAKAAIYIVDEAPDAAGAGSSINAMLTEAGWTSGTWQWVGVGGIVGVVVLIRQGSDQATEDAATVIVEALRTGGFNAAKGHWPADWRRFRGTLNGPQTPGPTEAPIRIVVGAKAQ